MHCLKLITFGWNIERTRSRNPKRITGDPDEIDLIESIIAIDLDLQTVLHSTRGLDFNSNTGDSDLDI